MKYDEKEYWNKRMELCGSVNTSKVDGINQQETNLLRKYIKEGEYVLDYGVGGGRLFPVYNEIKPYVQGLDIADFQQLIEEKRKLYKDFEYKHYILNTVDICGCEYPDNNFDVTVSFAVFMHIRPENIEKIVNELIRISGILICSSYNGEPLLEYDEQHCFLHDYNKLFSSYKIEETFKIGDGQFWVITKNV